MRLDFKQTFDTLLPDGCFKRLFEVKTMNPPDTTRQRLLDAAGPLFAERGFGATSVRDICRAAGVNQAAINYHFRDKEQFYSEAVRHAAACCTARVPLPTWVPGTPPRQKLRDFVRMFLERLVVD